MRPRVQLTGLAAGFQAVAALPAGADETAVIAAARDRAGRAARHRRVPRPPDTGGAARAGDGLRKRPRASHRTRHRRRRPAALKPRGTRHTATDTSPASVRTARDHQARPPSVRAKKYFSPERTVAFSLPPVIPQYRSAIDRWATTVRALWPPGPISVRALWPPGPYPFDLRSGPGGHGPALRGPVGHKATTGAPPRPAASAGRRRG